MRPGERTADATQIDEMLRGTPYTIDGRDAAQRFDRVAQKAERIRGRATLVAASAAEQAWKVLPQFELAVRSDLVAESNRMEGIRSSAPEIRDLARAKQDLLDMDVSASCGSSRMTRGGWSHLGYIARTPSQTNGLADSSDHASTRSEGCTPW